ncbi:MAG: ABC transporter transmembrane domain-containing protein [Alphaproteobacteria bacterium]
MPRVLRSLGRSAYGRIDILLSSVVINLLSLALPLVILQTYDRVIPNGGQETFIYLLAGLAAVVILDGALRLARAYITSWGAARFEHAVGCRIVDRMLSTSSLEFEREPPGTQLARFNAIETLRDLYSGQGMLALIDLPFVALFLALIAFIGGELVVVPLVIILVVGLLALGLGHKLRKALTARQDIDDRRYSFIIEVLGGMQLVKALALEELMMRRYERLLRSSSEAVHEVILKSGLAQAHGALFSNLTMISVAGAGAVLVLEERLTLGMLAACMLLAGRSVQPILRAIAVWVQFQNIKVAESRLQEIMQLPSESEGRGLEVPEISGGFSCHDVGFVYPGTGDALFCNLDVSVETGETVAVVGQNGSGKSTFLWLAMGLLTPTAGEIRYDGVSVADLDPRVLRQQIAYLPQRGTLYRGTIRENMTMFAGEDRLDSAMEIARTLELDKVLARLPDGLDTKLGNSSNDILAAGVRQRIAIVRALAAGPKIVLFDEANSAFDLQSDELLQRFFAEMKGAKTMVMVTHRPSLVRMADRVLEISNRQIRPRPDAGSGDAGLVIDPVPHGMRAGVAS